MKLHVVLGHEVSNVKDTVESLGGWNADTLYEDTPTVRKFLMKSGKSVEVENKVDVGVLPHQVKLTLLEETLRVSSEATGESGVLLACGNRFFDEGTIFGVPHLIDQVTLVGSTKEYEENKFEYLEDKDAWKYEVYTRFSSLAKFLSASDLNVNWVVLGEGDSLSEHLPKSSNYEAPEVEELGVEDFDTSVDPIEQAIQNELERLGEEPTETTDKPKPKKSSKPKPQTKPKPKTTPTPKDNKDKESFVLIPADGEYDTIEKGGRTFVKVPTDKVKYHADSPTDPTLTEKEDGTVEVKSPVDGVVVHNPKEPPKESKSVEGVESLEELQEEKLKFDKLIKEARKQGNSEEVKALRKTRRKLRNKINNMKG